MLFIVMVMNYINYINETRFRQVKLALVKVKSQGLPRCAYVRDRFTINENEEAL
ncbi:hypothetical protein SAMN05518848_107273 [Paenibacillus sp. PDC88]|nr:hypothetical protein SAMN05518848_107273 [Paenibacillus sp. PDC88]